MISPFGLILDERSIKIKQLLFYIVKQNIYELCVLASKNPQKWALFEFWFSTPTLTRKMENNNKKENQRAQLQCFEYSN